MILYDSFEKSVNRGTKQKSLAWEATLPAQRETVEMALST